MNNSMIWLVVVAGLVGLVIGLLAMWLALRGGNRKDKQQHQALLHKFEHYRDDVDRHFVETAAAVDELNRSYQKVIEHLSKGAQHLMKQDVLQEQLTKRANKSVTVAYLAQKDTVIDHADDLPPPPPYTDATEAEVVPTNGQPDRVPDRIGKNATENASTGTDSQQGKAQHSAAATQANQPIDLHQPKPKP